MVEGNLSMARCGVEMTRAHASEPREGPLIQSQRLLHDFLNFEHYTNGNGGIMADF